MTLKRRGMDEVPEMTVEVARAAFPKGNVYLQMREELGTLLEDEDFAELYSARGQPGLTPWRLALVTVMQFAENLTDRQAADAVRGRIDWKYALGLVLTGPGFDYSVLSEFRSCLGEGQAEQLLLDKMLETYQARGLLKVRGQQRTDSTHILAAIRTLNRLELAHETLYHALNVLAEVVPAWLKAQVSSDWFERYGERLTEFRLPQEQQALAEIIGADGIHLLEQVYAPAAPAWLWTIPAVETLRQVWVQSFYHSEGRIGWCEKGNQPPPAQSIASRDTSWAGYKVHLTETCDDDPPNLITHVETRPATEHDVMALDTIHQALEAHGWLPQDHLVDTPALVRSIAICTPASANSGLLKMLCHSCRGRRNHFPCGVYAWDAPYTLSRPRQNAFAAPGDCCRYQSHSRLRAAG